VDEGEGGNDSELHKPTVTAKPAAGKANRLRVAWSLLMMYLRDSLLPLACAHSSKRERTSCTRCSLMGSVLMRPEPSRMMGLPYWNIVNKVNKVGSGLSAFK
jgi:hypothetical protein